MTVYHRRDFYKYRIFYGFLNVPSRASFVLLLSALLNKTLQFLKQVNVINIHLGSIRRDSNSQPLVCLLPDDSTKDPNQFLHCVHWLWHKKFERF